MRTYHIYVLTNPNNDEIFYVGCSVNTQLRLQNHKHYRRKSGGKIITEPHPTLTKKENYILENKIIPVLIVVDQVCGTQEEARLLEAVWIKKMVNQGAPITNVSNNVAAHKHVFKKRGTLKIIYK